MAIYKGNAQIEHIYYRGTEFTSIYLGEQTIFSPSLTLSTHLTNASVSHSANLPYGEPLSVEISPNIGCQLLPWITKVTMGGTNITATAYNPATNTVSISSVTGNVVITAEAVQMSTGYVPVEYIRNISKSTSVAFDTGYNATEKEHFKLEMMMTQAGMMPITQRNATASSTPYIGMRDRYSSGAGTVFFWNAKSSGKINNQIPLSTKIVIECNQGEWSISWDGGSYGHTFDNTGTSFSSTNNIYICGNGTATTYTPLMRIYRYNLWRDSHLLDLVSAYDKANEQYGLYNTLTDTFIGKADTLWLGPE